MKKILTTIILSLVVIVSYGQYHCSVVSSTNTNVTLRSIGYGKNIKSASSNAEVNALKNILYNGAEGTKFKSPLILDNKKEIEKNHKEFFQNLYNEDYKDFIETSVIVTAYGKDEQKRKCITIDVCIRVKQLKTYLENNNIIRKFGF